jgi:hypothetical protein
LVNTVAPVGTQSLPSGSDATGTLVNTVAPIGAQTLPSSAGSGLVPVVNTVVPVGGTVPIS